MELYKPKQEFLSSTLGEAGRVKQDYHLYHHHQSEIISQIPRARLTSKKTKSRPGQQPMPYGQTTTMDIQNIQRQRQIRRMEWPGSGVKTWDQEFKGDISSKESSNNGKGRAPLRIPRGQPSPATSTSTTTNYTEMSKFSHRTGKAMSLSEESGIGFSSSNKSSNGSMRTSSNPNSQPSTISTNSRSLRAVNAASLLELDTSNLYHQVVDPVTNAFCANCHGVIIPIQEKGSEVSLPLKPDGSWNFNHQIHHPIQRNDSIGGFTLTGQDTRQLKRSRMSKFCSSHKIALVVSTFSFLVTAGLTITLILMKNKGMMEPM